MSIEDYDVFIEQIRSDSTMTPTDVVRICAERGWGPLAATWCLRHGFKISLAEAKMLTAQICEEHDLGLVNAAASKRLRTR